LGEKLEQDRYCVEEMVVDGRIILSNVLKK
jgi:hypothetical protein